MKKALLALSALACMSMAAHAAPETYNVDPSHTFARFSYSHFGLSTQLSRFNKTSGTIVLDKAAKTGAVDVTIDMTSVDTGFSVFDGHIQGADFLDTANHPTASFKSSKVIFDGEAPVAVEGTLTIKGQPRPVTLKVSRYVSMLHPMLKKPALGADASTVIKRSEFGAGKYAPHVGDDVTISIAVEAVKP